MAGMPCDASAVLSALQVRASETVDREELSRTLVAKIAEAFPRASRVAVWWLRGDSLVRGATVRALAPPEGSPEPEVVPLGRGVPGTAVAGRRDLLVPDTAEVAGEAASGPAARSQVVVVIRSMGHVVGAIDLEAGQVASFGEVDRCILRAIADSFGGLLATVDEPRSSPR